MGKTLKIVSLKDKQTDLEYWLSKNPEERLEAIEFLRDQYMKLHNVPPGLKRICRVISKSK